MAKSIALAADPSRLASLLLSYIPAVCAFVAPRHAPRPRSSTDLAIRGPLARLASHRPKRRKLPVLGCELELEAVAFVEGDVLGARGLEVDAVALAVAALEAGREQLAAEAAVLLSRVDAEHVEIDVWLGRETRVQRVHVLDDTQPARDAAPAQDLREGRQEPGLPQ